MGTRNGLVLGLALVCGLCLPAIAQPVNLLTNSSFEASTDNVPDNWTLIDNVEYDNSVALLGVPLTGSACILNLSQGDVDWGSVEQTVALTTGTYDLTLSLWGLIAESSDDAFPSAIMGELLVDGEVVAVAEYSGVSAGAASAADYHQMLASWKGTVAGEATVRVSILSDGAGGASPTIACVDDVELLSSSAVDQHAVTGVSPTSVLTPVASNTTLTIDGTELTGVSSVKLVKTGVFGGDVVLTGSNISTSSTSVSATFPTMGEAAGTFDIVVEKPNTNAQVIARGFDIIDSSSSPNLLINGSFEAPFGSNAQGWFGNYPNFNAEKSHDWVSFTQDGYKSWMHSIGQGEGETTQTFWQTVPVSVGSTVTFEGWVACPAHTTNGSATASATISLYDMTDPPTLMAQTVMDETNAENWTPVTIAPAGTVQSGKVKVEVVAHQTSGDGWLYGGSVRCDQFSLTASDVCAEPLHAMVAYPTVTAQEQDVTVTIRGGANLDTVPADGVSLVWIDEPQYPVGNQSVANVVQVDEPEIVIPGTIVEQSQTELKVQFSLGAEPPASYNVYVQKPSCPTPNVEWARVIRGTIDAELDPTHQPQLSGSMLDKVDVICGAPGCDSLLNGEFELPDADVPLCTELNRLNADPEYWMSDAEQDSEFARDITDVFVNTINFCPREVPNIDDYGHFAGLNAISDLHAWQTIRTFPSASYAFAGYFGGVSQNGASLVIRIVDGADPTGPVLAETTLASLSAGGSLPWTEGSVEAVAVSDTTTVVWGSENVLGNTLMVADGLSFKVLEIVCNQPFADADGDGDVDQSDFAVFQECFTGTNNGPLPAEPAYCQCFDVQSDGGDTGDGDIDSGDLLSFENCASGPDVPADPACN